MKTTFTKFKFECFHAGFLGEYFKMFIDFTGLLPE